MRELRSSQPTAVELETLRILFEQGVHRSHRTASCFCAMTVLFALISFRTSPKAIAVPPPYVNVQVETLPDIKTSEISKDRTQTQNEVRQDWPQFGGTQHRNNVANGQHVPIDWNIKTGKNIKWSVPLGSETYGSPVIANGKRVYGYPPIGIWRLVPDPFSWPHSRQPLYFSNNPFRLQTPKHNP